MTNDGKARPLAAIVGDGLKAFRERHQLRQSDLAAAAELAGLNWSRSSIAALEAGTRNLSVEELLLLPLVISNAGGTEEPFIPPESLVLLSRYSHVPAGRMGESFVALTQGGITKRHPNAAVAQPRELPSGDEIDTVGDSMADDLDLGSADDASSGVRELQRMQIRAGILIIHRAVYEMYPQFDFVKASRPDSRNYDLRFKVARRLDVPGSRIPADEYIQPFSVALWGRSFEAERDARAEGRGPFESPRSAQAARGHVTREMIGELNKAIAEVNHSLTALLQQAESVWDDVNELYKWSWRIAHSMGRSSLTEVQLETLPVVGDVLATARKSQSLSVSEVADAANVGITWVGWIESGMPPLDIEQSTLNHLISMISEAVGVDAAVAIQRLNTPLSEDFRPDVTERGRRRKPPRWRRD